MHADPLARTPPRGRPFGAPGVLLAASLDLSLYTIRPMQQVRRAMAMALDPSC